MCAPLLSRLCLAAGVPAAILLAGMATDPSAPEVEGSAPLAVVVHKSCTAEVLSVVDLRRMLTGDLRAWPDKRPVVLIQEPERSDAQRRMLRILLRTTSEGYRKQLLAVQFQGKELPLIKTLNSDDTAIKFVWNLPGAISIVNAAAAAAASEHVRILRIDGKLPGEPGYLLQ